MILMTMINCKLLFQDSMIYLGQRLIDWSIPVFLDGQPVVGPAVFKTSGGRHVLILNLGNSVVSNMIDFFSGFNCQPPLILTLPK